MKLKDLSPGLAEEAEAPAPPPPPAPMVWALRKKLLPLLALWWEAAWGMNICWLLERLRLKLPTLDGGETPRANLGRGDRTALGRKGNTSIYARQYRKVDQYMHIRKKCGK